MSQGRVSPVQEWGRVSLARAWAIEAGAKVHVGSGTRFSFVHTETSVGSPRIIMMHRLWDRPSIAGSPVMSSPVTSSAVIGSPVLSLGQDVTEVWPIENACVLSLKPVIEPGKRLDMKTLPRPGEAIQSPHCDLQMLAIGQSLVGGEGVR